MATIPVRKLEEHFNCSICLDTYTAPKMLQCFHSYCQQCLVNVVGQDQLITCPTCRQVTPLPATGVRGLQTAFHITQVLDMMKEVKVTAMNCEQHMDMQVEVYCETCGELICWKCIMKGKKHSNHDYQELNEALVAYKAEMTSLLVPLERNKTSVTEVLRELGERCSDISKQQETVEGHINDTIKKLHSALDTRKRELVKQLDQITLTKLKNLAAQKNQLEATQAQLNSCLHFIKEKLKSADTTQVLQVKKATVRQARKLTMGAKMDMLMLDTKADVKYQTDEDNLLREIKQFGKISDTCLPDASEGESCTSVGLLATPMLTIHRLKRPDGVAMHKDGRGVVVAESGRHCVSVFSPTSGQKLHSFGKFGSGKGQFREPSGVAVDNEGNILVADTKNHRIQKFTAEGKFMDAVGKLGTGPLCFYQPLGIAFNFANNRIYIRDGNSAVQILTSDLKYFGSFGKEGSGVGKFSRTAGHLACSQSGRVYVADSGNHRVQVFTAEGKFLRVFGGWGEGKGELEWPVGIAADLRSTLIYVSEHHNDRISIFTSKGQYITSFGRRGNELCNLGTPNGLAVFDDTLYAAIGNCVTKFCITMPM